MKLRSLYAPFGMAFLLVSCSSAPDNPQTQVGRSSNGLTQIPGQAKPQNLPTPVVGSSSVGEAKAVPGLLQPTNAKARIPSINPGRRDPFASVSMAPITLPAASRATVAQSRFPTQAGSQGSLPKFKPTALPNFSANAGSTPLPPVAVSAAPRPNTLPAAPISAVPPVRSSLAEEIEVSGVMQVGGKWTIIVKEPGAPTSRYVSTGDYLANGRVFVKRIVPGADPVVILQQNGVEVTKSIGSSTGPIAHR